MTAALPASHPSSLCQFRCGIPLDAPRHEECNGILKSFFVSLSVFFAGHDRLAARVCPDTMAFGSNVLAYLSAKSVTTFAKLTHNLRGAATATIAWLGKIRELGQPVENRRRRSSRISQLHKPQYDDDRHNENGHQSSDSEGAIFLPILGSGRYKDYRLEPNSPVLISHTISIHLSRQRGHPWSTTAIRG